MDIPETGAVFTLGKSYLSENHQSYFFIKNDPIRKVIAGNNQSAVICESGRLFVWGENQYGQLSAGSKEVISKPSCVKEIKNLGYKVRNIAFGEAFSVILTENNKIFFSGKSIFTANDVCGSRFRNSEHTAHCVIRHNYEFIDFHKRCLDNQGNLDDLVDIVAGRTHFVVLTNSGKLYCYGFFDSIKNRRQNHYSEPRLISEHLVTRIAKCGSTFVVLVTDCNGIYVLGKLNSIEYTRITKLNTSEVKDTIYSIYVSQQDDIFLISSSGDVYKSTNSADIEFERIILFNQKDNIRKFCAGSYFVCVITDKNKFLTTFNEKASAKSKAEIRLPHELRKFQDLRILDIAAGLYHILLFAVAKTSTSNSFDITSSDPNENIPILSLPGSDSSDKSIERQRRSTEVKPTNFVDFKNTISSKPVLDRETLEAIHSEVNVSTNTPEKSDTFEAKPAENNTELGLAQAQSSNIEIEEPINRKELNANQTSVTAMDLISNSVANIGESIKNDMKSIATAGEEKLNDLAKETEKTIKDVPKNVIDYVKTSVGLEKDEADNANTDETKDNTTTKDLTEQLSDSNIMNELPDNSGLQNIESSDAHENENVAHNNMLNDEMDEQNSIAQPIDDGKTDAIDNEVKFINNGVDVSNSSNIVQAMHDEINEMSNNVQDKSDELTMKYEGMVDNELTSAKEAISTKMFEMKSAGKGLIDEATSASADLMTKIIPLKRDLDEVDLEPPETDGDTEQVTASIKSGSTPAKIDEQVDTMDMSPNAKENEGRVKRFFNDIKNNCKTTDTVLEIEEAAAQKVEQMKSHSLNDIMGDNKTSKVCTIL